MTVSALFSQSVSSMLLSKMWLSRSMRPSLVRRMRDVVMALFEKVEDRPASRRASYSESATLLSTKMKTLSSRRWMETDAIISVGCGKVNCGFLHKSLLCAWLIFDK